MMLTNIPNSKSSKLYTMTMAISLFALSISPSISSAAPTFTGNTTSIDLGQPGLQDMETADFNNDGFMDVILSEFAGVAGIKIFFSDQNGSFGNAISLARPSNSGANGDGLPFSPDGIGVGFINNDNALDIVITAGNSPGVAGLKTYVYFGSLDTSVTPNVYSINSDTSIALESVKAARDAVVGDFNKDTFVDVVVADDFGISIFLGTGNGTFNTVPVTVTKFGTPTYEIFSVDVNNDTYLDIVTDHQVLINNKFTNLTAPFDQKATYRGETRPLSKLTVLTTGFFNNDKLVDIAYILDNSKVDESQVVILTASGTGANISYTKTFLSKITSSNISDIAVGDIDLDGKDDVILIDDLSGSAHIYTGLGNSTFASPVKITITEPSLTTVSPKKLIVITANNDRLLDIITANKEAQGKNPTLSAMVQNAPAGEIIGFDNRSYAVNQKTSKFTLSIPVSRKYTPVNPGAVSVNFTATDGTAKNGTDYTVLGNSILDFASNVTTLNIDVDILTNTSIASKDFTITLTSAAGLVLPNETVTVTILDSTIELPIIKFKPISFELNEDPALTNINMLVTVERTYKTASQNTTTSVYLSTTDGTGNSATANLDYTPIILGSLTNKPNVVFTGNQTSVTVPITIINDKLVEGPENFRVILSNPVNGVIAVNNATVTIIDNDFPPANAKPIANADGYTAVKNKLFIVDVFKGLLSNDSDADLPTRTEILNTLKVSIVGTAPVGLLLKADGSFTFKHPTVGFSGMVSFDYNVSDGTDSSVVPGKVIINVFNTIPVANSDVYSVEENKTLTVSIPNGVLKNDTDENGDTLLAYLATGSVLDGLTLDPSGSFTYTPAAGVVPGDVTFKYFVNDGTKNSAPTTVIITVFAAAQVDNGVFSFDTANTYSVSEKTGEIVFNVIRNLGKTGTVRLTYSVTGNNSATFNKDFTDNTATPNTLVFAVGVTSMPITIGIATDDLVEGDETFVVSLDSVDLGVLANADTSKIVTIIDSTNATNQNPGTTPVAQGGSGGGCTLQTKSHFDPILPLLTLFAVVYFIRRTRLRIKINLNL